MNRIKQPTSFVATLLVVSLFTLTSLNSAYAHSITKVKGKKVLISVDSDGMTKGENYFVKNKKGKKIGIVRISKVKGKRAIGILRKGKAKRGYKLTLKAKRGSKSGVVAGKGRTVKQAAMYWGGMVGMGMNSMNVTLTDKSTVALSGSGSSVKGLFDFALFTSLWFRGLVGMETFSVSGTAATALCTSSTNCVADITYLSADMWGRYLFSMDSFRPWAGFGFLMLFPSGSTVTALDANSITNTSAFAFGGGFDWFVTPTISIPFQVEYDLYPSSADVSASTIAVRLGITFTM